MNDQLQKALISKNASDIITITRTSTNRTDSDLLRFLAAQLHDYNWSLLDVVKTGDSNLTELFLEANDLIDVNYHGNRGRTALHEAVDNFNNDIVKLLLEYNADPNSMDESRTTPIGLLYTKHVLHSDHDAGLSIIKMLSKAGANAVTHRNHVEELQVSHVLMKGTAEEVEIVLNMNVDLNTQYKHGNTVAHCLASNGLAGIWTMMRDREFAVDVRNDRQETPLWCAANAGVVEAVEVLLSKGADVNAADRRNFTPIYAATSCYSVNRDEDSKETFLECIMLLLEYGANIQVPPTDDGRPLTILDVALKLEIDSLWKLVLEHLALQEALGTTIIDIIRSKIESIEVFQKHFNFCKNVLAEEIYQSKTTFDLLTCKPEKLIPYTRNEKLLELLFDRCYLMEAMDLHYYYRLLNKRLIKARETAELRDSAAIGVGELMQIDHDRHFVIMDNVMKYLDNKDLITIISLF